MTVEDLRDEIISHLENVYWKKDVLAKPCTQWHIDEVRNDLEYLLEDLVIKVKAGE